VVLKKFKKSGHRAAVASGGEAREGSGIIGSRQWHGPVPGTLVGALLGAMLLASAVCATEPAKEEQARAELARIQERIREVERSVARGRAGRRDAFGELAAVETALAGIARDQRRISAARARVDKRIVALRARAEQHGEELARRRAELGESVRLAFAIGRQDTLKLILNGEGVGGVPRLLRYHEFMSRRQLARIAAVDESLASLEQTRATLAAQAQRLQALLTEQEAARAARQRERAQRQAILGRIEQELGSADRVLSRLKQDRERLNALLRRLRAALADIPLGTDPPRPFQRLRGKLPWPVKGQLVERFGTPRADGGVTWQGVVLAAEHGTEVRAIANGRVVYASELRGFGNVIILDHGGGYMSLYGHTQTPLREPGEWVNPGDVVATVGDSGGARRSALYFEVRHKGTPQDPGRWCS
jgi:septal ring factor EnvC (AmiA/AmiB activator)